MSYSVSRESVRKISRQFELEEKQIETVIELLDEGNTIPFLARYRKEKTGGLDENQLRDLEEELEYLSNLEEKKEEVREKIAAQDELTEELKQKLDGAETLQEVEDIYYPYKPRRQTRADKAVERGLEPLAGIIWEQQMSRDELEQRAEEFVDEEQEVETAADALQGARDILADRIAADPELKALSRQRFWQRSELVSEVKDEEADEKGVYEQYYDFSQPVSEIPAFRVLALNRGEDEDILRVKVDPPQESILSRLAREVITKNSSLPGLMEEIIEDAFKRLQGPALEREVRSELTERAEEHAREIFADNLEALLLQSPLPGKNILGIDPAYRTGCKLAVIDTEGNVLDTGEIFPHEPRNQWQQAKDKILDFVEEYGVDVIASGNGTASQETEMLLSELNEENEEELPYTIVDEAGASVYSASELAGEELPGLDVSLRGAVSIARRLQDPLAELVKIDPRSIGVGLYQHDIDSGELLEELEVVVESVVNRVGVNLNTASPVLLSYISGLNSGQSEKICDHREAEGAYTARSELLDVRGIGPKTFEQAAGFLRLKSEEDPLARTPIHPESYEQAEALLARIDMEPEDIIEDGNEVEEELKEKLNELLPRLDELADELEIGRPTLRDIISALKAPERDPRDEVAGPVFRTGIKDLEDLEPGEVLQGTVRNVVDFGAFVDVGLKVDGLIHVSELAEHYVDDPTRVIKVGDVVRVKVLEVDERRERISLSRRGLD